MKTDEAQQFVGGGDRDFSDEESARVAQEIANGSNAFDRWAEGRSLEERTISTRTATVRSEDGEETEVATPAISDGAVNSPEGFGGTDDGGDGDEWTETGGE